MPRFSSLVARVRAEAPHVALASVTFRRRELVTMLANGDLDLALDVALPADERMCRHYLGAEPLVVVARKGRSEEHTSELQSLMRISYAVFCLKKKKIHQ